MNRGGILDNRPTSSPILAASGVGDLFPSPRRTIRAHARTHACTRHRRVCSRRPGRPPSVGFRETGPRIGKKLTSERAPPHPRGFSFRSRGPASDQSGSGRYSAAGKRKRNQREGSGTSRALGWSLGNGWSEGIVRDI